MEKNYDVVILHEKEITNFKDMYNFFGVRIWIFFM